MAEYKLISADSHIVEPPDMYTGRIEPRFRDRAPKMERRKTPGGREYDAWMLGGMQVGTLGAVMQAGQRFEDPSQIDFLGLWEDVRKGAYTADAMIVENEEDGIWGSVLQPSQGLFWYRIPDSDLLTEICRVYNDWIADFCKPHARRRASQRVHDECRRDDRRRPLDDGLLGALLAELDAVCRRFRSLPGSEDRLGRARSGVDPALAEADGLHLCRAAGLHQGLAVERRADAERLLEAQHVCRVHGRRYRHQTARLYRRREHAVGQRLSARRGDVPAVTAISVAHVRRRARGRAAQNHLGECCEDVRLRAQLTAAAIVPPAPSRWREEAGVIGHPEGGRSSGRLCRRRQDRRLGRGRNEIRRGRSRACRASECRRRLLCAAGCLWTQKRTAVARQADWLSDRVPTAFRPVRHADREIDRRADLGRYSGLRGPGRGDTVYVRG